MVRKLKEKGMTVYVTQENPRVDMVSDTKWGELIPLSSANDQVHLNPMRMITQITSKLKGFSDDDYLLAVGDPAIIGIAFTIASNQNDGHVNLLKWDKFEKMYYLVKINFNCGIED